MYGDTYRHRSCLETKPVAAWRDISPIPNSDHTKPGYIQLAKADARHVRTLISRSGGIKPEPRNGVNLHCMPSIVNQRNIKLSANVRSDLVEASPTSPGGVAGGGGDK